MRPVAIATRAVLWLTLMVGGCATTGGVVVRTVVVDRPMPVSCVPPGYRAPPDSPVTREALLSAIDAAARYQLLAQFWAAETPELVLQRQVIEACRAAAPADQRGR